MNSIDRFLFADGLIKNAWGDFSKSFFGGEGSTAGTVAGGVTDMLPVVGGLKQYGQGIYQAAHGNWGKALANAGWGTLSMFGGGLLGAGAKAGLKGVGLAARLGSKLKPLGTLATKAAPTLAPMVGRSATGIGRGISAGFRAAQAPGMALGKKMLNVPGVGGLMRGMEANPGKSTLFGTGAGLMGSHIAANAETARQGIEESRQGMQNMLQKIHQNPMFESPLYAGGGKNPNYADVNPMGYGGEESSGTQMASSLLGPALSYFTGGR